jgi:hypothetical protein
VVAGLLADDSGSIDCVEHAQALDTDSHLLAAIKQEAHNQVWAL